MRFLRALRKLVLGETWAIPIGVAATVALAAALRPSLHAGVGFLVLAGAVVTLAGATRS
jgi:hypothetical protein